jgi:hypothetical protein
VAHVIGIFFCISEYFIGHSFMTSPKPIDTAASNTQACGGANGKIEAATTPEIQVFAGNSFQVLWPNNGHSVDLSTII